CRRSGLDCPRAQSSNPLGYAGSRTLGVCAPITYRLTGNSDCGAVGMVCYRPNAYPSRQNHHSDCAPPSNFTPKLFTVTFSTAESGFKRLNVSIVDRIHFFQLIKTRIDGTFVAAEYFRLVPRI